jgi:O-antigen/teichoic acid export membrane protein
MSFVNKLIKQSSVYMICELLIMMGGFLSFPIFTRLLTKQEYGVMNLISITLTLVEEFSSMGIRHAVNRFYSSINLNGQCPTFYSTTIYSSLLFGIIGTIISVCACNVLAHLGFIDKSVLSLLSIAVILIITRVMTKVIGNLYRMREKAKTYSFFALLTKYLGMGISILLVAFYAYGITGFFWGLVVGEIIALILLVVNMIKQIGVPVLSFYSYPLLREMIVYGFPLLVAGLSFSLMSFGDRYLIGWYVSAEAVAMYSVPYNLCSYIQNIFVMGFQYAYFPLVMKEWDSGDEDKARRGIVQIIRIYCMCAIPIVFGMSALGEKIISTVASDKYAEASYILPYVITGEMLAGLATPLMMGFVFMRKPGMIVKYGWYAATANIIMNMLLIPILGILGAAVATLCSYMFHIMLGARTSFKYFAIPVPYSAILKYVLCSTIMYATIKVLGLLNLGLGLISLVLVGSTTYLFLIFIFDEEVHKNTMLIIQNIIKKRHR